MTKAVLQKCKTAFFWHCFEESERYVPRTLLKLENLSILTAEL